MMLRWRTKKKKEKKEEMRKRATERLGETRRRHPNDSTTPERKRRRNSNGVVQVLKESVELKHKEQELAAGIKEREIDMWQTQVKQQQAFFKSI